MLHAVAVRDLETELRENVPFPVAEAVDIVVELAEVLARTHELGAVNGRVSTANIVVERGVFGTAKLRPASVGAMGTRTNQSIRSHLYLSPEQIADTQDLLAATDIWSLGVVLYELMAGRPPFPDAEAIKRGTFAPLRGVRECPAPLEMAITSCLQRSPFARTQSIASFALNIAPFGSSRSKILIPKLKAMEPPASDPTMHSAAEDRESEPTPNRAEPASDPTLQKADAWRNPTLERAEADAPTLPPNTDARHAADDEGATMMVPTSASGEITEVEDLLDEEPDTFVKPTVPVGFAPLGTPILPTATPAPTRAARVDSAFKDKTQRISSAQLQELGKHITAVRGKQTSQPNVQAAMASPQRHLATMPRAPSSPELGTPISNIRMRDGAGLAPADAPPQLEAMKAPLKPSKLPVVVSVVSLTVFIACVVAAALILLMHR